MSAKPTESLSADGDLQELERYRDAASLGAYLQHRPDLCRSSLVEQLAEAVRREVRVNVERALWLAEAALAIAKQIDDAKSLGLGNRAKANALWFGGNLKAAVELFDVAVNHFERADATEEVGRTLSSCIQPLLLLGDYNRALESAGRARKIFQRSGDALRLARLEINVANIHHRQDRFAEALASYQRAYEKLLPYKDQEAMAAALHNMAVCLIILNDFDRALETYRRARNVAQKNNMPLVVAQADYNIAYLHFLRGDYGKAMEGLRATRELCRTNGNAYHAALCDLDQSEIYLELNLNQEAARMAHRAQEQFERLAITFEAGRSVFNFAIALHQQDESFAALDLFATARDIFARENNAAWQALIGLYRALVLLETGQASAALGPCREALEFFVEAGLDRRVIFCRLLLSRIARATGRLPEAQEQCEAALRTLATVEAPQLSYHAHLVLGDIYRINGRPREGYRSYQRARRSLEKLRSSLQGEELKIAFMKNKVEVYEKLVEICLERKSRSTAEKAFAFMEQAKSRSLIDTIFGQGSPLARLSPIGMGGERVTALRQELNWYYRRIEIEQTRPEGISPAKIHDLQARARSREDELLQAIRDLPRNDDGQPDLQVQRTVALEEVRATLGDDATLLEYFQIGSKLLAAVLTRTDLEIVQLGEVGEITSAARLLEFQLSKMQLREFQRTEFEQSLLDATESRLRQLYCQLVAPLVGKLRGRHLVVVPHGVLHYLPFHALSDGNRYLIDRFTFSYAPSASIHTICHMKHVSSIGPSLLLGVHDRRAPWIRQEILSVSEVLPDPQVLLGRNANANMLRKMGASSRFIHLATHCVFRRDNPLFSSLRLADSYLNIYDLYQLKLPAELLTLSGCGTGLSAVAAGDELLGLIRGLLATGTQSLLLTLWDVHDQSTAHFMEYFYSKFQKHGDKGLALREAMLDLRRTHPHPYYWAPFALIGKGFHYSS
jgi:CHAT domain-containing protein/predicted negative regulator of RcsB-dependent stress response